MKILLGTPETWMSLGGLGFGNGYGNGTAKGFGFGAGRLGYPTGKGSGQSAMNHYAGENDTGKGRSFGSNYGCSFSSGKGLGNEVNK